MPRNQELDKLITWMSHSEQTRYRNVPVLTKMVKCLSNLDGRVGFSYKNWLQNAHSSQVLMIQINPSQTMSAPLFWIPGYLTVHSSAATYIELEDEVGTLIRRDFAGNRVISNDSNTMLAINTTTRYYLFYTLE